MNTIKKYPILCLTIVLAWIAIAYSQSNVNGWKIAALPKGKVDTMSIDSPKTPLGIEQDIILSLGTDEVVTGGKVEFKNGVERIISKMEGNTYFEMLDGPKTLWDYLESQGQLIVILKGQAVPTDWNGKTVRIVEMNGRQVIGTLHLTDNPLYYGIYYEGAAGQPVHFSMNAIKALQQIR